MLELRAEERDLVRDCSDIFFGLSTTTNYHGEGWNAGVATAWVDAANSMVLILANISHIVGLLIHLLPVKEGVRVERAIDFEGCKVWRGCLEIIAKVLSIAHAYNPV